MSIYVSIFTERVERIFKHEQLCTVTVNNYISCNNELTLTSLTIESFTVEESFKWLLDNANYGIISTIQRDRGYYLNMEWIPVSENDLSEETVLGYLPY